MPGTLIRAGAVLTMDPALGDLPGGEVLIEGGRIARVGRGLPAEGAEVVDAPGMILLPGFVDAHLHTWQTGIRGVAGDWSLAEYFRHMHLTLAPRFAPGDLYLANLVGAWNQLNNGATALFDWCHNNPTPEHTDAAVEGLIDSGVRALFGHGTPRPRAGAGAPAHPPHPAGEVRRLRTGRLSSEDALVTMALAIRGPDLSPYEVAAGDIRLAREWGMVASCHVGGRLERMAPEGIHRLAREGLLGPWFNAVHANQLSDEELRLLAGAGATVTACPEVEMQMGHGLPAAGRFLAQGGAPSLGVDVESNISGDMFTAMRMALQYARAEANQGLLARGRAPERVAIPLRRALEWATIGGARALGLADRIGSLAPGKQADLILIRTGDLNLFPGHDPAGTAVFQAGWANVEAVFVAGRALKRGGKLLFPGLKEKMEQLAESGRRILREAGIR